MLRKILQIGSVYEINGNVSTFHSLIFFKIYYTNPSIVNFITFLLPYQFHIATFQPHFYNLTLLQPKMKRKLTSISIKEINEIFAI